jgi:hypothetical protein
LNKDYIIVIHAFWGTKTLKNQHAPQVTLVSSEDPQREKHTAPWYAPFHDHWKCSTKAMIVDWLEEDI